MLSANAAEPHRTSAEKCVQIRAIRGYTHCPALEGALENTRRRRFPPVFVPSQGWQLVPNLCMHFRLPANCSLFTVHHSLDLHVLRKRTRPGNRFKLLWLTVLQQRPEHLAERGPDECEISFVVALYVLCE